MTNTPSSGHPNRLAGMTALITGGSGAISGASAQELLRDGASVLLMARGAQALEDARAKILKVVPNGRVEVHAGDAQKEADVQAAIQKAYAMQGRLDIVVSTVGGSNGFHPLMLLDADTFRAQFERNVISAFLAVRYSAPVMQPGGAIVCISSTAGSMPFPYLAAYHTAKGGLENFIRAAAEELSSAGIRVNGVRPALTRSDRAGPLYAEDAVASKFVAETPLGRLGEPEDIARVVRFLAGPESAWVTGQSFAADGGQELRKNPDLSDLVARNIGKETLALVKRGKVPSGQG